MDKFGTPTTAGETVDMYGIHKDRHPTWVTDMRRVHEDSESVTVDIYKKQNNERP